MTYINQNVLNNLFYILISLFVFYFAYDNGNFFKRHRQLFISLSMGVPLIFIMKFPILITEQCIHDLRQIPFIVGTLYGGWPVGLVLLMTLMTTRVFLYGFNMITLVVYVTMFVLAASYSAYYMKLKMKKKLLTAPIFTLFLAVLTTMIAVVTADFEVTDQYVSYFIVIPPVVVLIVIYIIETLEDAVLMRSKLIKVEKMEVISQLAASISHEVRNPLTVVKGFIQLLREPGLNDESKAKYINYALDELNRAQTIIGDYLTFAKPAPEKLETIKVEDELNRVIDMIMPLANMNAVQVVVQLTPATVYGNRDHFHQCFINLFKNSIEAMPNGGVLHITCHLVSKKTVITIKDNGIGMTPEQISRFGEPYFSTKETGTGLGTMVALKIIETMHGTLEIQSTENKGTTLTVTFR